MCKVGPERRVRKQRPPAPARRRPHGLRVWVAWVLVCAAAGVVARSAGQFLSELVLGLTFGVAQWFVLWRLVHRPFWTAGITWVVASSAGGFIGFFVGGVLVIPRLGPLLTTLAGRNEAFAYSVAVMTLLWTCVGAAQWLVLRRHVQQAAWWIPASAVGGLVFVALAFGISTPYRGVTYEPLYGAVGGAGYGAITGIALAWLVRNAPSKQRLWVATIPVIVAGAISLAGVVLSSGCDANERAVFAEFPQYGGLQPQPLSSSDSGGCTVLYETPDPPAQVLAYFEEQLTAHGWTLARPNMRNPTGQPGGGLTAQRGSFRYMVLFESLAFYTPPRPGTHVAVHVTDVGGQVAATADSPGHPNTGGRLIHPGMAVVLLLGAGGYAVYRRRAAGSRYLHA